MSSATLGKSVKPKQTQQAEGALAASHRSATLPARRPTKPPAMGTSASVQQKSQEANGQATQPTEAWGKARIGIFARLDRDSLPDQRDSERVKLFCRVQLGQAKVGEDLRLGKTDANQPGPYNRRLLHAAAESGRVDLLAHLIDTLGANVDALDADDWSAAHFAASADAAAALGELVRRYPRLGKQRNRDGQTPLMTAVIFGAEKSAAALLRLGKGFDDVEAFDPDGDTAAMLAVKCHRARVLRLLLLEHKKGAAKTQLKQRNRQGKSVADLVKMSGDAEMAEIVKAAARK